MEKGKYDVDYLCVFVIAGVMALGMKPDCKALRRVFEDGIITEDQWKDTNDVCVNDPVRWGQLIQKARYWVCIGSCK